MLTYINPVSSSENVEKSLTDAKFWTLIIICFRSPSLLGYPENPLMNYLYWKWRNARFFLKLLYSILLPSNLHLNEMPSPLSPLQKALFTLLYIQHASVAMPYTTIKESLGKKDKYSQTKVTNSHWFFPHASRRYRKAENKQNEIFWLLIKTRF